MTNFKTYKVGIYFCLGKDNSRDNEESLNKENKDFILTKHVHDNGWNLFETYCDDGYSGANLDRPALQRMLQDVRDGHINTILVKDLSGLGRNYLDMGHLAEEFLPEHHRKLISFAEIVDDMVDLRNIINERLSEMHPKSWTIIPTEEGHFLT